MDLIESNIKKLGNKFIKSKNNNIKYEFGLGESPFGVIKSLDQNLKKYSNKDSYLPSAGLPELRKEIAQFYSKKLGRDINPNQVLIGPGSKNLIFNLFMAFNGRVFVPIPAWVSYLEQLKILKKKHNIINTRFLDDWKINENSLLKNILKYPKDNRILIFNNPHNPTGTYYKRDEVEKLAKPLKADNLFVLCAYSGMSYVFVF